MTDQHDRATALDTAENLRSLVPDHAQPDDWQALVAAALRAGLSRTHLHDTLARISWAGRGTGYTAAVLKRITREAGTSQRPTTSVAAAGRRTLPNSIQTCAYEGIGRTIHAHPYAQDRGDPVDNYCTCGLPRANRVHR